MRILCDAPRAGRRGQGSGGATIIDHLARYLGDCGPAASVALYQTPRGKGLLKSLVMGRPPYSEILGVCHMKAYVFDDEVLVSGANLNERYFTTRQDRYVSVRSAELAERALAVVRAVARHSFRLSGPAGTLAEPPCGLSPLRLGTAEAFSQSLHAALSETGGSEQPPTSSPSPSDRESMAWVFPLVQNGSVNYRQDEQAVSAFLDARTREGGCPSRPRPRPSPLGAGPCRPSAAACA